MIHTMQIACHTWAFNDDTLEDALGTIARLGFRHVDLGNGPHLDLEQAASQPGVKVERILTLLHEFDLALSDLYIMLPYINTPDPNQRETQLALFERLFPFILALDASGVTLSPGVVHPDGPEHSLARSVAALMRMSNAAEGTDLRLSFEPHMDSTITTPEQARLIGETVPGLSITLDYAHFIVQGYSLGHLTPLLGDTAHVHLRQAVKGRLQTPFDQGRLDFTMLINDLVADYHGTLAIEYMTTVGWHGAMDVNIAQEVVRARDEIRNIRAGLRLPL